MRLLFYFKKEESLGKTSEILTDGHKEIIRKQIISGARSLRRAKNSTNAKAEKRIIAVLAKNNGDKAYGELVYLSSVRGVYKKNESLIDKMDEKIMMRFMEILTRPE